MEVSAVTWPAYDRTEIYARSKEALESARAEVLERARQAAASAPEGADINALALAKEKTKTILLSMEVKK